MNRLVRAGDFAAFVIAAPSCRAAAAIARAAEREIVADDTSVMHADIIGVGHAVAIAIAQQTATIGRARARLIRAIIAAVERAVAIVVAVNGQRTARSRIGRQACDARANIGAVADLIAIVIASRIVSARQQSHAQIRFALAAELRHAPVGGDMHRRPTPRR